MNSPAPLLQVENLSVEFHTDEGVVRAVQEVSFSLYRGQTLALVGESGCGKTVTSLAVMGLVPQPPGRITGGRVLLEGTDLLRLSPGELQHVRGRRVAMVFQDPMTALNPFLTIGEQLTESMRYHLGLSARQARSRAGELLERVGIPGAGRRLGDYPHQFSGGMRQRVVIAMALACRPQLVIADEPTTALDVTIQAQILDLLRTLQQEEQLAVLLITHDLGVVADMSHHVAVMYAGRIVEQAPTEEIFARPRHPYTHGLLGSVPRLDEATAGRLTALPGEPPNLARLPSGCAFHPRCPFAEERCRRQRPEAEEVSPEHTRACFVSWWEQSAAENRGVADSSSGFQTG